MDPPRSEQAQQAATLGLVQLAEHTYRAAKHQNEISQRQEETIRQLRLQVTSLVQENNALRALLRSCGVVLNGDMPSTSTSTGTARTESPPSAIRNRADVGSGVQRSASENALLKRAHDRTVPKSPVGTRGNSPLTNRKFANGVMSTSASSPCSNQRRSVPASENDPTGRSTLENGNGYRGRVSESSGILSGGEESHHGNGGGGGWRNGDSRTSSTATTPGNVSTDGQFPGECRSPAPVFEKRRRSSGSRSLDDHSAMARSALIAAAAAESGSPNKQWPNGRHSLHTSVTSPGDSTTPTMVAFSFDIETRMEEHVVRDICRDYGCPISRGQRAAKTIQQHYRNYRLAKRVHTLRTARRSGMFRRASETDIGDPSLLFLSSSGPMLSNVPQLQAVPERDELSPPPVSDRVFAGSESALDSLEQATQLVMFDDLPARTNGRSSPTGYAADNSSLSSAISLESVASGTADVRLTSPSAENVAHVLCIDMGSSSLSSVEPSSMSTSQDSEQRASSRLSTQSQDSMAGGAYPVAPPPRRRGSICYEVRNAVSTSSSKVDVAEAKVRKQRKLRIGITHFNRKPAKGVSYLISKRLLSSDPKEIALFLKKQGGLSREMVGNYLGNLMDPLCQSVLREYVNSFKLEGLTFVQAMRKFLLTFRIPGEAQKIERILELFADQYVACNPSGPVSHPDTIFILAFSTIMLNTDLHNASVKTRMTKEDFVRNNRGIDDGKDLPLSFLEEIFDDIQEREFATPKDHVLQVLSLQKSIIGNCPDLAKPHRQLVHVGRFYEIFDKDRKQAPTAHSRFLFLFNDMLLVAKYAPRKSLNTMYAYKTNFQLLDVKVEEFSNTYYKYGVILKAAYDGKILACFHGEKESVLRKFAADLKEVLMEIQEMEHERIHDFEELTQRRGSAKLSPDIGRHAQFQSLPQKAAANADVEGAARARSQTMPSSRKLGSTGSNQGESRGSNLLGTLGRRNRKKSGRTPVESVAYSDC